MVFSVICGPNVVFGSARIDIALCSLFVILLITCFCCAVKMRYCKGRKQCLELNIASQEKNKGGIEDDVHIMYVDSSVWSVMLKIQMIKIKFCVYQLLLKIFMFHFNYRFIASKKTSVKCWALWGVLFISGKIILT